MHFLDWTLDQQDEFGNLGTIAKVLWQDINNGCGARYTTPMEWRAHFQQKHPKKADILSNLLAVAYVEYSKTLTKE